MRFVYDNSDNQCKYIFISGDVSCELSRHCSQVYLSTQRGGYFISRTSSSGGYPIDAAFLRRSSNLLLSVIPVEMKNAIIRRKANAIFDHDKFGLGIVDKEGAFPKVNDEIGQRIATGHIIVKPGIKAVTGDKIEFKDGTFENEIDAIVFCTGFKRDIPFLPKNCLVIENDGKFLQLFKNIFPPKMNGKLAFVGFTGVAASVNPIFELQARCAAAVFNGTIELPDEKEMCRQIYVRKRKVEDVFGMEAREYNRVRYCFNIINYIFHNWEDLVLVYTISDYFSCWIAFLNLAWKTLQSMSVYKKSGKQPSDTKFRAKIISLRLPYLLFSLPICQAIDQPHLQWSHLIFKARFGSVSYEIRMFTRQTKRYTLYRIHFHATCWSGVELYRIVEAEHVRFMKSRINTPPIRYIGDPVSYKQGLDVTCVFLEH